MERVKAVVVAEARKRLRDESFHRIVRCLDECADEEVWRRPNEHTVSIGNLVLHLCGNVRQWIIAGVGGAPDVRRRDTEFEERGPVSRPDLIRRLDDTITEALAAIERLPADELLSTRSIQGNDEVLLSAIIHVIEHFSYHTGQISYAVKTARDIDLGYYAGQDLNVQNK